MGYPMKYDSAKEIMEEIGRVTPSYCGIHFDASKGTASTGLHGNGSPGHAMPAHG